MTRHVEEALREVFALLAELPDGDLPRVWGYLEQHLKRYGQHLEPGVAPYVLRIKGLREAILVGNAGAFEAAQDLAGAIERKLGVPTLVLDAESEHLERVTLAGTKEADGEDAPPAVYPDPFSITMEATPPMGAIWDVEVWVTPEGSIGVAGSGEHLGSERLSHANAAALISVLQAYLTQERDDD